MVRPTLDVWFEFASTYSYPAVLRAIPLARAAGIELHWRPFLLGPILSAQGWTTSPFNLYPAKGRYMWRDLARICARLQLPLRRPDPFPQASLLAARVALVALADGFGERFIAAVYRAEFGEGRQIADRSVIAAILEDLAVDPDPVLARAGSDAIKQQLREQTEKAQRIGLFGAPSFVATDGEIFWGNDRLEAALEWTSGRQQNEAMDVDRPQQWSSR